MFTLTRVSPGQCSGFFAPWMLRISFIDNWSGVIGFLLHIEIKLSSFISGKLTRDVSREIKAHRHIRKIFEKRVVEHRV